MRHKKLVSLATEQDIETACRWMDLQERDALPELEDEIADVDDERALLAQARSCQFDDGW
jgi:hypothetical protein